MIYVDNNGEEGGKPAESVEERLPLDINICLGFGSNIGQTDENLLQAIRLINGGLSGDYISAVSTVYLSSPVENTSQPYFLNFAAILRLRHWLKPDAADYASLCGDVLSFLKDIEKNMGRKEETKRYMPRIIDIDMLFVYDNAKKEYVTLDLPELKLPHTEIFKRKFVLKPLLDLAYNFKKPFDEENVKKALNKLDNSNSGASQKICYYGKFDKKITQILR